MKRAVNKVMLVGRATVFTVGLAVTLALMAGVATAALAAVPGDPLKLGQRNAMDALTTLAGSANGAMLKIENNFAETKGASALALKVPQGNPPLTVNPEAGTATNLSADKLDGLDQGAFLRSGAKANDADRLDGMDSAALYPTRTYGLNVRKKGGGGQGPLVMIPEGVHCDPGDKLVTGGAGPVNFDPEDALLESAPHDEGWWAMMRDGGEPSTLEIVVRCADLPPLRP